jgi:hypothetical protein
LIIPFDMPLKIKIGSLLNFAQPAKGQDIPVDFFSCLQTPKNKEKNSLISALASKKWSNKKINAI